MSRLLSAVLASCGLVLSCPILAADDTAAYLPDLPALKDVAPETIVTVNGTTIPRENLAALAILLDRDRILDTLINVEVIRQEAQRRGVTVTPAEIEAAAMKAAVNELDTDAQRRGVKSQADLVARGVMTADEAAAQRKRLAPWYRPMAAFSLVVDKLMLLDLKITDDDLRAEFDRQYGPRARLLQVVLRTRDEAEDVVNRLNAGADFGQLARDLSIDRVSGAKGGELPAQPRGSPLGDAALALKPGQIAPIVQTANGYHVVKVLELQPGDSKKRLDDVREVLRQEVTTRLLAERRTTWMRELRAKAVIRPSTDIVGAKPHAN